MTALIANSLWDGFLLSNFVGKAIIFVQGSLSLLMIATVFGKWRWLKLNETVGRRFQRDFNSGRDSLDYHLQRRQNHHTSMEMIYAATCDRLLKLLTPDTRALLVGRDPGSAAVITPREVELVRATCTQQLDEEEINVEHGMGLIAAIVMVAPMLGLLGTVWGVLDAFADMGSAASASLAVLAPSISAALVTTVVGLLVAIPGALFHSMLASSARRMVSDLEAFGEELMGRIACEFSGSGRVE